ncbi:SRPBCC domain-containing protein [Fulvivirgaceae bacterium BMA12]|uniref:SRPBCC domain-containing protein n=1 Tax=Agaribacillus aureus TaxID=3051825 RepID=A0ABT8L8C4_9BACT|nr:SRPBCC domain-containing protein [Fulvivirgaceae bacterium BMA12]
MTEKKELMNRTLLLQRTFNAPRKLVWEAWTQPEHIAAWWGPRGMKTAVVELDFRPGGRWKYIMTAPDGSEFPAKGVFSEIIEFEKIVSSADFAPVTESVIIVALFEDLGDQTKLTFSVIHASEEYCRKQENMGVMNGWGANFDGLEAYLARMTN